MKIVLQPHLKIRLKERLIPERYPKQILRKPDIKYLDPLTDHRIAIKSLHYNGKKRPMVVAYDIIKQQIQVITVYPTTMREIKNRVKSKRWVKYESN